jgi:hypothetical protein
MPFRHTDARQALPHITFSEIATRQPPPTLMSEFHIARDNIRREKWRRILATPGAAANIVATPIL